jgi:protocatechuate 3,4-dioxygenase beta subunit
VHQLRVDGFLPDPARSVTVGSAAARDVELEVGLGSAVVGRVTRADGAPVEGATVAIYHGDGAFALVTTDAGGRVERAGLHAGPAIVVVSAPGLVPVRSVVELGAAPLDISSTLELGSTVTGTVRGPDGQPLSGAEVKVEIDPELPAPARVATDGAGRYAIAGVPAGAWGLEVAAEGLATRQVSFVADGSAPTTVDVGLTTGGSLTGQVTRRDTGGPFAEASVWVVSELGPPREITTDASGRYAVTDLAPGGAVLTISDPDAVYLPEQHEWTVEDGVETTFDAALGLPSVVRGRVRDAEGRDVAGVSVSWDSMAGPASTLTDADGEYELVGVAPGPVQIDVGGGVVRRPVSVPGDGAEVVADVVVDARRVSGRLLDGDGSPAPNALVGVFVGDAFVATAKSESDGTFTALIFEPGTYELRAGADGFGTARTTVVVGDADVVVGDVEAGSSSLAIEVTVDGDVPSGEVGASLAATGSPLQYAGDAEDDQVTFSDLEVGVYTAVVFGEGGATRQVEIQIEPGGNEVTIDLDPAVAVVGRVEVGGDGAELASVFASGVANGTAAFALTSAGGDFVLDGLAPGATRVSAFDVDGRNVGSALVDVGAGGAIIEIDLAPAPLADVRVVADGDAVVNAAIAARDAGPIPGPSRFTEGDGRATVALPAAGPVTMVAAAPGRPVVELSVDDPGEAEVVVDVGPTIAVGLQAPEVSTLGVKSRSKSPTVRDLSDTGFGELVAWISRHASPVAWVGYFTYNEGLEPQRNEALEESVDANLKALLRLNVQPGREFCPGFTESLNEVENLRRQVEVAYSGWVSAQDAFDIAWDDAKVRLPLGLAKIVASLGLMLVSAPLLAGATTLTLEIVAGAGLALGLLDAFVSIVTGALDAIPGAFTYEGFLSWLNNMKDAISAGGTQAAAALSVWIEGLKAIAKNPKGAAYLAYSELVTGMKLLPAGVTKLQHWTMKSVTWLNQKVPIAELGAKVLGYAAALLDFVSLAQAHAESVRLVQGADDARAVGQRNYNELLRRLFAETRRALALGSKDCKKDPKFVLRRKRNLQGSFYVPSDPNDIVGPAGPGAAHWLAADPIGLEYTINFENLGPGSLVIPPGREPAKIAAALVDVTMPIDTDLDIDSFELGDIGWADIEVDVPEGRQSWSARLGPYEDLGGIFVDVSGEVDRSTRTVRWIFKAIDPETGDTPIDERGFLVPENGEGDGQGWIRFRADAVDGLANGTRISQQASIVFDTEDPLATNVWTNRIDTAAPKVTMRALRPTTDKTIELAWIGVDTGSGAASYDVYVAVDGGPLKLWKSDVTARSAVYRGAVGSRYGFAVRATDRVGYVGVKPRTAQTTTRVVADTGGSGGSSGGLSGFVAVGADRAVYAEGGASFHGSLAGQAMTSPVVSIARTPTGKGYWILTREGQVYTFGDARFHGTTRASYAAVRVRTNAPAVAIMGTPTGRGYWIVTRDGGVFSFGDARFHGSLGGVRLAEPIVAAQATATGRGYWLVGEDGGVFTFGDAAFRGSPGGRRLDGDVVGFDVTGGGSGYVLITERGTLHAFGKATRATASGGGAAVGIVAAPKGGYWVIGADGGVRSVAGAGAVRDLRPLVHARILATS